MMALDAAASPTDTSGYVLQLHFDSAAPDQPTVNLTPLDLMTGTVGADVLIPDLPQATPDNPYPLYEQFTLAGIAVAPDDSYVLCGGYSELNVAELAPLRITQKVPGVSNESLRDVQISADGTTAVAAYNESNALTIVQLPTIKGGVS
jgi:hypothetical protein